jgi:predicted CxxxxCH...CXXCH cytochrome family protein
MSVGAHRSHLALSKTTTFHAPVECASCHLVPAEVQSPGHIDDDDNRAELTFGALARTGGAEPVLNEDGSCSNVYCHGSTLTGGSLNAPIWNVVNGTARECGTCHGAPPPAPHPANENCGSCHPTVSAADNRVFLDPTLHINGIVEVTTGDGGACDSCHGSGGDSAPPTDLAGNTERTAVGVGAHREHLALSTWRREINCSNCHVVPVEVGAPTHIDGDNTAEVPFDALNPTGTVDLATGTCSNLYCHGNGRASNGTASWTDVAPMDCNSCHLTPNPGQTANGMSGDHNKHIRGEDLACVECHAGVVDANTQIIGAPLHVDGQRNVLILSGGTYNPANRRCSNLACHENESW